MVEIAAKQDIYKILKDFIDGKSFNLASILARTELFRIELRYEKYESAIDDSVARFVIANQNFIYKLAVLAKYQTLNRRLPRQEKQRLKIPFEVKAGSTVLETVFKGMKDLVMSTPEKSRAAIVITFILSGSTVWLGNSYINHLNRETSAATELEKNKTATDADVKKVEIIADIAHKAIDALSKNNPEFAQLAQDHKEDILAALSDVDSDVIYQGEHFSPEDIKELKKKQTTSKAKKIPDIERMTGVFRVISINFEQQYIYVEKGDYAERVYYQNDLTATMTGFYEQFETLLKRGGKDFYIEASHTVSRGKKAKQWQLTMIRPQ